MLIFNVISWRFPRRSDYFLDNIRLGQQ